MSFYSEASLVMIPSGVKEGKVYSAKPVDGTGDLTFSRGSDIEATRINANGLIQKAQVNLLLQSNQFDTTWLTASASVTGGQAGYDGTNDAWLLNSSGGFLYQTVSLSASVFTYSVYAKAGTADGIRLRFDEVAPTSDVNCYINLTNGTEAIAHDGIDLVIQDVGNGWWRISLTHKATNLANVRFYTIDDTGTSITGTIYIQDAQLNYGLVAQDYVETTTAAVVTGITDNMPRLNYDAANPTCPSLLLEPSRTNGFPFSEYFGGWTSNRLTSTANDATSPEGVQNAYKMAQTGGFTTAPNINFGGLTASTYTISIFAKAGTRNFLASSLDGVTYFNLSNGTIGTKSANHTAKIENYGSGWYRCSITRTTTTTQTAAFYFADTDGTLTTADDGGYMYTYGAQAESSASYPSSYIPTYGSSATRTAEACSKTGIASLIGQSEGTLFFDGKALVAAGGGTRRFQLANSGISQFVRFQWSNGGGNIFAVITTSANTITMSDLVTDITEDHKVAIRYKQNDFALFVNGVKVDSNTSGTTFSAGTLERIVTDQSSNEFRGEMNQFLIIPTALSDTELATLTA